MTSTDAIGIHTAHLLTVISSVLCLQESTYGLYILVGITFLLFGGILYLVCQESRSAANEEKKDN